MCVSANQIGKDPKEWRVGGVPLLSMLRSEPKVGYNRSDLVVASEDVDLQGEAFQSMKAVERDWRVIDHYSNPGPIQFADAGSDDYATTLKYRYSNQTNMSK